MVAGFVQPFGTVGGIAQQYPVDKQVAVPDFDRVPGQAGHHFADVRTVGHIRSHLARRKSHQVVACKFNRFVFLSDPQIQIPGQTAGGGRLQQQFSFG